MNVVATAYVSSPQITLKTICFDKFGDVRRGRFDVEDVMK
jgi:hypothetical protein